MNFICYSLIFCLGVSLNAYGSGQENSEISLQNQEISESAIDARLSDKNVSPEEKRLLIAGRCEANIENRTPVAVNVEHITPEQLAIAIAAETPVQRSASHAISKRVEPSSAIILQVSPEAKAQQIEAAEIAKDSK